MRKVTVQAAFKASQTVTAVGSVRRSMGPARIRGRDDSRSANGVHATASTPSDRRDGRQGQSGLALCACSIASRSFVDTAAKTTRDEQCARLFLAAGVARLPEPAL